MNAPDKLPLGLVRGMPAEQYHRDPGVSNTMLSAMNKSPAHCYALHLDPDRPVIEATDAQAAGKLTHTMILEPAEFASRYIVKPAGMNFSTKAGMAWRDAVPKGLEIVTAADHEGAKLQRATVMRVEALRHLFASGIAEASLFWNDQSTGLRCRARPDWLHFRTPTRVVALDVKKIDDLTPDNVERSVTRYGYHRQAAHYTNGLRACGMEVEAFGFAFVSGSYPYLAAAYLIDDESAEQGFDEVAELLARFADCKARNDWPAFGNGFQFTGLTKWARRSHEVEVEFVD